MGLTRPRERPLEDMFKAKHGMYARTYVFNVIFMDMGGNDGAQPGCCYVKSFARLLDPTLDYTI